MIAGFIKPSEGDIRIAGAPVGALGPDERGVGIVFQNYALFPHMNVARNVEYGLSARGQSRVQREARVDEMLRFVQMTTMADRFPSSSPADSSSALRWPVRSRPSREFCCSTSHSVRSTRICASTCKSNSNDPAGCRDDGDHGYPRPGRGT